MMPSVSKSVVWPGCAESVCSAGSQDSYHSSLTDIEIEDVTDITPWDREMMDYTVMSVFDSVGC